MIENFNFINKNDYNNEKLESIDNNNFSYEEEVAEMFNLGKKKKKSKEKKVKNECVNLYLNNSLEINKPFYNYNDLLDKLYKELGEVNQNTNKKLLIPQPIINKLSIKKVLWINFYETCINLNRNLDHLVLFVNSELSTETIITENKQLIIKGKYNSNNIENLLRKYICLYVQCNLCRSNNTIIKKDNINRIQNLECLICKGVKSLPQIKLIKK